MKELSPELIQRIIRMISCDLNKFLVCADFYGVPLDIVFQTIYFELLDRYGVDKTLQFFRKCLDDENCLSMKDKQIFKVGDAVTWRDLKGTFSGVILASVDNCPWPGNFWLVSTPSGLNMCLTEDCLHHV